MHYIILPILALVGAIVHILIAKTPVSETLLQYILFFCVGISGLYAFMGHGFAASKVSKYIGWEPGSPFQWEVAVTNLAFGILGILSFWFHGGFWIATIIGVSVFDFGAAYGHIRDIVRNKNRAPGNAGAPLYTDIVKPVVLIGFLIAYL